MPLRILHLSDIHFHQGSVWDDDLDLHDEVVADIARVVAQDGPIDIVLVGGDIAFSAQPAEYEKATHWLNRILDVCGDALEPSQVWTVPGNHDVERAVVEASLITRDFRDALTSCDPAGVDTVLKERLVRDPLAHAVMSPLANYNEFAIQFGCAITAEAPSWTDSTLEVDGVELYLSGLNSVLTSDKTDSDKPDKLSLVLGTQQCRLPRASPRIHVAMVHHPPTWLRDWSIVEPYLRRAHVVLFGHEHEFSVEQPIVGGSIRVRAGAVSPERRIEGEIEPWIPSYSVLTMAIDGEQVRVSIDPRKWDLAATRFSAHPGGTVSYMVALDPPTGTTPIANAAESEAAPQSVSSNPLLAETSEHVSAEEKQRLRRLTVKYLRRSVSDRRRIARELGVLTDDDLVVASPELSNTILVRIREGGLIGSLEEELAH